MTQQFHEGQEVEVATDCDRPDTGYIYGHNWRKAKIVRKHWNPNTYEVQFLDDSRAIFDAAHIREIPNRDLAKMTPDELQDDVNDCYCSGVKP